jgi:hypothetical protein
MNEVDKWKWRAITLAVSFILVLIFYVISQSEIEKIKAENIILNDKLPYSSISLRNGYSHFFAWENFTADAFVRDDFYSLSYSNYVDNKRFTIYCGEDNCYLHSWTCTAGNGTIEPSCEDIINKCYGKC